MSELKAYIGPHPTDRTLTEYYLKSEADKVIAELNQKINEAQAELELWRDGSIISEVHQKELDQKRHSDYKRCLAMASKCRLRARWFGDNAFYKKEQWALKWHKRWLELAETPGECKNQWRTPKIKHTPFVIYAGSASGAR